MSKAAGRRLTAIDAARSVGASQTQTWNVRFVAFSVEPGYDSREFTLLPFGGAGGLHAVDLAAALRIRRIIVPNSGRPRRSECFTPMWLRTRVRRRC